MDETQTVRQNRLIFAEQFCRVSENLKWPVSIDDLLI
jgi:hypothetical protein